VVKNLTLLFIEERSLTLPSHSRIVLKVVYLVHLCMHWYLARKLLPDSYKFLSFRYSCSWGSISNALCPLILSHFFSCLQRKCSSQLNLHSTHVSRWAQEWQVGGSASWARYPELKRVPRITSSQQGSHCSRRSSKHCRVWGRTLFLGNGSGLSARRRLCRSAGELGPFNRVGIRAFPLINCFRNYGLGQRSHVSLRR
jgi:hypothetical protein